MVFSLTTVAVLLSFAKDLVLNGMLPVAANTGIQSGFVAVAVAAIVIRRAWFHQLVAFAALLLFGVYIALLFTHLPD